MEQISYNIVSSIKKKNKHMRAIAQLLNINHMTISRKIKQLEKENILDFNEEGKNKVYFLKKTIETEEFLKIIEHNKLIQIIKKYPRLRKIVEIIKSKNIELAIIFGSYAKGNINEQSDIDIYINSTDRKLKKELELTDSKLNIKLGEFNKENLLIKEIIKNNIIIKGVEKYYELIN